jgi:hypothetical protein
MLLNKFLNLELEGRKFIFANSAVLTQEYSSVADSE